MTYEQHRYWMQQAIALAAQAGEQGEIPVGALLVDGTGHCIAQAHNRREQDHDPTGHAELLALRQASQVLQTWRLTDCTLYVTLEPCPMCAGAILQSRLKQLVYGADDPKSGAVRTVLNLPDSAASCHRLQVLGGICEADSRQQLQNWFAEQRHQRSP